eukprot:1156191-Pelagomonas_calceolata.AAC.9
MIINGEGCKHFQAADAKLRPKQAVTFIPAKSSAWHEHSMRPTIPPSHEVCPYSFAPLQQIAITPNLGVLRFSSLDLQQIWQCAFTQPLSALQSYHAMQPASAQQPTAKPACSFMSALRRKSLIS